MKWSLQNLHKEAFNYSSRNHFKKNSRSAYITAWKRGILDDICSHMPKDLKIGSKPPNFRITKEIAKEDALKYSSKIAWKKRSMAIYNKALKMGWMTECSAHMTRPEVHNKKWTKEACLKDASAYDAEVKWLENSPSSYAAAQKFKWLEECTVHMKTGHGTSGPEEMLFNIIKSLYPNTKKLRHRRINIKEKPYIKGFDIDICVPELSKGIEFDGTYFHSFEYMRSDKSKNNWPDEDVRNYHQIKDNYFLSKGVEILHIKEEDWIINKQACIQKCYDFLNIKL